MFFISSSYKLKSNMHIFSSNLSFFVVFGITAVPLYTPHLKTIYASLLEYFFANWFIIVSFKTDSSYLAIPISKYDGAPKLLNAVTAIPFSLQKAKSFSYVK